MPGAIIQVLQARDGVLLFLAAVAPAVGQYAPYVILVTLLHLVSSLYNPFGGSIPALFVIIFLNLYEPFAG